MTHGSRADRRRRKTGSDPSGAVRAASVQAGPGKVAQPAKHDTGQPQPVVAAPHTDDAEPQALVVSHWFEAGPVGGPPYVATIHLTGHRRGVIGRPARDDAFSVTELVSGVVPGSGRVSTTTWVSGVSQGEWDVSAQLIGPERACSANAGGQLHRARWSWRRWSLGTADGPLRTRWAAIAPLAPIPAVLPGSFTALALVALLVGIGLQPTFLDHGRVAGPAVVASIVGLILGIAGAKSWYMVLKGPSIATLREGWSVDGFLVVGPLSALAMALLFGIPLGAYLDAVTPGLFAAVAVGRVGCFLTGCCAGRPTASWGLWSSDRRVGARRIPAQLLESAVGVVLTVGSAVILLTHVVEVRGLVFVLALIVYVIARQSLLRLRAESRRFSWRRAGMRPTTDARIA